MQLLYVAPSVSGGLGDYARAQANALVRWGTEVVFLAPDGFIAGPHDLFRPTLYSGTSTTRTQESSSKLARRVQTAKQILRNAGALYTYATANHCQHVFFNAYGEYLAPLWAGRLRCMARCGVAFGAVVHDPVRDAVIGPRWWHRCSIAQGYSFLREAFVHESIQLDTVRPQPQLRTTVIPHGPYPISPPAKSSLEMRRELQMPDNAKIVLAFGHIRDAKNLDLLQRALVRFPDQYLVVAGKELSGSQKPCSYYQQLASDLGIANRCRWLNRFIGETEVGDLFNAADLVALTYSGSFRSASGVLNLAVGYRKPCIASSGPSNLRNVVQSYHLGIWVEPDSEQALIEGFRKWDSKPVVPDWDRYERDNSWAKNAELVTQSMFEVRA